MANDRKLKTGYIIHFLNEYVSIMHCNDVFDERAVVKKMVSANVNHIHPFVGERRAALFVPFLRETELSRANMNVCAAGNQDRNRTESLHDILL
jgi:hypothetical protein